VYINYADENRIKRYSFYDVLMNDDVINAQIFKDTIVLI
jgi:hypothetical protein